MKKLFVILLMVSAVTDVWAQKLAPKDFNAAVAGKSNIQLWMSEYQESSIKDI